MTYIGVKTDIWILSKKRRSKRQIYRTSIWADEDGNWNMSREEASCKGRDLKESVAKNNGGLPTEHHQKGKDGSKDIKIHQVAFDLLYTCTQKN